jgi:hypothetical protein
MRHHLSAASLLLAGLAPALAHATPPGGEPRTCRRDCFYVARHGDYLAKLAQAFGVDADEMWNHPDNAELKSRRDPNILHPTDIVRVPAAPARAKTAGVKSPGTTTLRLNFVEHGGQARANQPYTIKGMPVPIEGITDSRGAVVLVDVPVELRELTVVFTKDKLEYPVLIGGMEPVDEPSGARARLENLGFHAGAAGGEDVDERDHAAIRDFQRSQGIEATGVLDEATKAALVNAHGS